MAFTEKTKLEAKKLSNFQCCVCFTPFVEVHHIIPQENDGSDALDNAATLCGGCHQKYGGNRELQKQLREMRDHWWERCKNQNLSPDLFEKLDSVGGKVDDIKNLLIPFVEQQLSSMRDAKSVDGLSTCFAAMTSGDTTFQVNVICNKCQRPMHYLGGIDYYCPSCDGPYGKMHKSA